MTSKRITTLAALRSFYDSGSDLLGVFCNLVINVLSTEKVSISEIHSLIEEEFVIKIPYDVLQTILKRLRRNGSVEYETKKDIHTKSIYLTQDGGTEKQKVTSSFQEADREKNALIKSIKSFCKNNFDENQVETGLNIFIEKNSHDAIHILEKKEQRVFNTDAELQSCIASYFVKSEQSDPENFNRLKTILLGKIISSALLTRNFDKNANFEKLDIYLDTNIVFSLMGFHEDSYNEPTKEIITLVKELGFRIKIFSFTKKEVVTKLSGYLKNYGRYSSHVRVDSIYSVLKRKNYSTSDVILIINNIDEKLSELDIEVDYSLTIDKLISDENNAFSKLQTYKEGKPHKSIEHDLAVVFAIKKLRKNNNFHLLEKSKFIFLTADSRLSAYNYCEHKELRTIPEAIYRNELTSILWLKNQNNGGNVFVHNFLISNTRQNLISNALWEKFLNALDVEKVKGDITDKQIEEIISWEETEKILQNKKDAGIRIILDDQRIKQKKEGLRQKDIKIKQSSEEVKKLTDKLIEISDSIERKCKEKVVSKINIVLWIFLTLYILLVVFIFIYLEITFWNLLLLLPVFIFIELRFEINFIPKKLQSWIPDSIDFLRIRANIQNKLIGKCIGKEKKDIGIED